MTPAHPWPPPPHASTDAEPLFADTVVALYRPGDPGDQPCWRRE